VELAISQNKAHIDLFKFLGMFPGGISLFNLNKIWQNRSWEDSLFALCESNLVVKQVTSCPTTSMIHLLPYMIYKANSLLDTNKAKAERIQFHSQICQFYLDFLTAIYKSRDQNGYMEELVDNEPNIWACIHRGLNKKVTRPEFKNPKFFHRKSEKLKPTFSQAFDSYQKKKGVRRSSTKVTKDRFGSPTQEELMVLYYVTVSAMMDKTQEAERAIDEYLEKPQISPLVKADFYKLEGLLKLMRVESD
jgi:hypothetical protein